MLRNVNLCNFFYIALTQIQRILLRENNEILYVDVIHGFMLNCIRLRAYVEFVSQ